MKCSSCRTNALHMERYFVDRLKEILELAKLVPVVFGKKVALVNIRFLVALIKHKGILQVDTALDH